MAVTTWQGDDGSSPTDWGTAANWDTGSVPDGTSDVVIPDCSSIGNCILDGDTTINSLQIQGNGNFSMNNHDLTIDGENGSGRAIDIGNNTVTFVGGTGTLIFTLGSGATNLVGIEHLAASTELRNLQFNGAATFVLGGAMTVNGNLTITAGTLSTSGDNNYALTVTGKTEIDDGGTLTCNASTVSLGSGQRENWYALLVKHNGVFAGGTGTHTVGSFAVYSGGTATLTSDVMTIDSEHSVDNLSYNNSASGTLNHGSGTVTLTYAGESRLESGNDSLNNLIINHSSADIDLYNEALTCAGDLTITAGELNTGSDVALTVTGDVSVTGTLTGNASAISMGSLTIASGGTYSATSGTTTLTTGNATYSAEGNFALVGGGTFTHNNGTLVFDSVGQRLPKGGTFYNVTLTGSQTTGGLYLYSSVLSPAGIMPDGTTGANYISILGTLTITDDELRPYNVDKIYVHNLIIGDGTGSANSAKFDMAEADGFDGTVFVDNVTIHSDGQLLFGDGDETSATVGSSALNIYGAFRNLGGNVTIE